MEVNRTGYIVGGAERPSADEFVSLLRALRDRGLVEPQAAVSIGTVTEQREVGGARDPGAERTVAWEGAVGEALFAAVRAACVEGDVAVFFPAVTARAFARPANGVEEPTPGDDAWDHAGTRPPSFCVYSVHSPLKVSRSRPVPGSGRSLGRSCCWAALDGPDMRVLAEYLADSRLHTAFSEVLGRVNVGEDEW